MGAIENTRYNLRLLERTIRMQSEYSCGLGPCGVIPGIGVPLSIPYIVIRPRASQAYPEAFGGKQTDISPSHESLHAAAFPAFMKSPPLLRRPAGCGSRSGVLIVSTALRQRRVLRKADRVQVFFSDSPETKPLRLMEPQEDLFFR